MEEKVINTNAGGTVIVDQEYYNKITEKVKNGYIPKSTMINGKLFITFEEE